MTDTSEIRTMKRLRDRHFLQSCRRVISESSKPLTAAEVAVEAALAPAPEFYVSYCYALKRLRMYRRRGVDSIPTEGASAVFRELDRRVSARMERTGDTDSQALAHVLAYGHAPCFYLRPSAAIYLYSVLKQRSQLHRRRHRHVPLR